MARPMPSQRRKPGPVPKGGSRFPVRVPVEHRHVYEQAMRDEGFSSLSDYVAAQLARLHDLEVPAYAARTREPDGQEALPVAS